MLYDPRIVGEEMVVGGVPPPGGVMSRCVKRVSRQETGAHGTRTVERACAVLCAFSATEPRLSLRELADRADLPKATAHRLAGSLVASGFLEHRDDGRYVLGLKLSELGAVARAELDIVHACSPAMDALAEATRETVLLAAADWEACELTIVATRVSPHTLSVAPMTGQRQTIPTGAPGKALLLGLPAAEADSLVKRLPSPALTPKTDIDLDQLASEIADARSVGYATAEDEYLDGVSGVAIPALFEAGWPRAAIGVVGPSARIADRLEQIGRLALELTATLRPASAEVAA
jgi:IclR family transcriptional regulator, acetate operon repressor